MSRKILEKLHNFDLFIAGTALSALIVYTFFGVIMRYFINRPIHWGEEFQLLCMTAIVFFGAGAGFRTGSHVAIDFVVDLFPLAVRKVIAFIIFLISLVIMIYFSIQGYAFVRQMYVTQRYTPILLIPYYLIYAGFPLCCVLVTINNTIYTVRQMKSSGKETSQ